MSLVDKEHFFREDEISSYHALLEKHDLDKSDFEIVVTEDQTDIDMNDMDYVVILHVKVTYRPKGVKKTYSCTQYSGLWICELHEDILAGFYD